MILDLLSAIGAAYLLLTVGEYLYCLFRRHPNPTETAEATSSDETATQPETVEVAEDKNFDNLPISIVTPAALLLPQQQSKRESPQSSSSSTTRSRRQQRRNKVESARLVTRNSNDSDSSDELKLDTPVAERPSYSRYRRHKRTHSAHFSPRLINTQHPSDPNSHIGYTGSSEFQEFYPSNLPPNDPQPQPEMPLLDFIKSVENSDDKDKDKNVVHWEIHKIPQTQLPTKKADKESPFRRSKSLASKSEQRKSALNAGLSLDQSKESQPPNTAIVADDITVVTAEEMPTVVKSPVDLTANAEINRPPAYPPWAASIKPIKFDDTNEAPMAIVRPTRRSKKDSMPKGDSGESAPIDIVPVKEEKPKETENITKALLALEEEEELDEPIYVSLKDIKSHKANRSYAVRVQVGEAKAKSSSEEPAKVTVEEKLPEPKLVTTIRVTNATDTHPVDKSDKNVIVLPVNTQEPIGSNEDNLHRWKARLDSTKIETPMQPNVDNFTTIAIVKRRVPTAKVSSSSQEESEIDHSEAKPTATVRRQTESAMVTIRAPPKVQKTNVEEVPTVPDVVEPPLIVGKSALIREKSPLIEEIPNVVEEVKLSSTLAVSLARDEEESANNSFVSATSEQPANWYSPPPVRSETDMPPLSPNLTTVDGGVKSWGLVPGKLNLSSFPTAQGVASNLRTSSLDRPKHEKSRERKSFGDRPDSIEETPSMGMGNGKLDLRQSSFNAAVESGVIADGNAMAMGTSYRPIYELRVAESRIPPEVVEDTTASEESILPRMNVSSKAKLFEKLVEEQNEKAKLTRRFMPRKKMERAHTYQIDSRPEMLPNVTTTEYEPTPIQPTPIKYEPETTHMQPITTKFEPEFSRIQSAPINIRPEPLPQFNVTKFVPETSRIQPAPIVIDVSVLDEIMLESSAKPTVLDTDSSTKSYAPVIRKPESTGRVPVNTRWEPIASEPYGRQQITSVPPVKQIDTAQDAMEDERTKLSLAEKTKFFEQKMTERPAQPELQKGPRRMRRYNARYQTQPITLDELKDSAARISPPPIVITAGGYRQTETVAIAPSSAKELLAVYGSKPRQTSMPPIETVSFDSSVATGFRPITPELVQRNVAAVPLIKVEPIVPAETKVAKPQPRKVVYLHTDATKTDSSADGCHSPYERSPVGSDLEDPSGNFGVGARREPSAVERRRLARTKMQRNPARRQASEGDSAGELQLPDDSDSHRRRIQRSRTQPVTEEDIQQANMISTEAVTPLSVRLAALKGNADSWRERIEKENPVAVLTEIPVKMRVKGDDQAGKRPVSIADRLNLLSDSQEKWQDRIKEKDSAALTVAAKMEKAGLTPITPMMTAQQQQFGTPKGRSPAAMAFGRTRPETIAIVDFPDSGEPIEEKKSRKSPNLSRSQTFNSGNESHQRDAKAARVEVPGQFDVGFADFYAQLSTTNTQGIMIDAKSFDQMASTSPERLGVQKTVKPPRRKAPTSGNPLKSLAARQDIQSHYNQLNSSSSMTPFPVKMPLTKPFKSVGIENPKSPGSHLAPEAIAALQSVEDITAVTLRKINASVTPGVSKEEQPYRDKMLLQIKGRRHVQVRLVEPIIQSVNNGDSFILVTPDHLFLYLGEFASVVEKAKAKEVATAILSCRDLGCKKADRIVTLDGEKPAISLLSFVAFWQLLGGSPEQIRVCTDLNEDDVYEGYSIATNMVYKVREDSLVPYKEYWGQLLRHEMLDSKECIVFDFGSEMYVWQGKQVEPEDRKKAMQLAKDLWDSGYNYSECDINPISGCYDKTNCQYWKADERPDWAVFGKINDMMETVLFKGKFFDWPETKKPIRMKSFERKSESRDIPTLKPIEAGLMLDKPREDSNLVLEGTSVGRGNIVIDNSDYRRSQFEIITQAVKMWHVKEFERFDLPEQSFGQFHSGDTYVIRWQFMMCQTGMKSLDGKASRHSIAGRERCAYFFWQGANSSVNAQGAAALMTVELDAERGPHVRVSQGKEPAAFRNLFHGGMVIHSGNRDEKMKSQTERRKLMRVEGEFESEACLTEVELLSESLREQGSYLLVSVDSNLITVWHGCMAKSHTRKVALLAAQKLSKSRPLEIGFLPNFDVTIAECDEHSESAEFRKAFGCGSQEQLDFPRLYRSFKDNQSTMRIFNLTNLSGEFTAVELSPPTYNHQLYIPFPYLQKDLYDASQPALFLCDGGCAIWLWIGWLPADSDALHSEIGSAKLSFQQNLNCALTTVKDYQAERKSRSSADIPLLVVFAGCESDQFVATFPTWTCDPEIFALQKEEFKSLLDVNTVEQLEAKLHSCESYPLEVLATRPLPTGVDSTRLELYLSPTDFYEVFKMSRSEFDQLPSWKQTRLKQEAQLF